MLWLLASQVRTLRRAAIPAALQSCSAPPVNWQHAEEARGRAHLQQCPTVLTASSGKDICSIGYHQHADTWSLWRLSPAGAGKQLLQCRRAAVSLQQLCLHSTSFASCAQRGTVASTERVTYKGVEQVGRRWRAHIRMPRRFLPSQAKRMHIGSFSTPAEAAAAVDVHLLALYGDAVRAQHLNFPAGNYSSEEVEAVRQTLAAEYPLLLDPAATAQHTRLAPVRLARLAVGGIAARVATTANGLASDDLAGVHLPVAGLPYRTRLAIGHMQYTHQSPTAIEAAVVFDLVRISLYGPEYSINFPPHTYTDGDVEVVRQDIQQRYPDMHQAAVKAARVRVPKKYHLAVADRGVRKAASMAAAAACDLPVPKKCRNVYSMHNRYLLQFCERLHTGQVVEHTRYHLDSVEAAAAADMLRQAAGRPAFNLPAHITAPGVPAMKQWLELNRLRLTVEKDQWTARAAAVETTDGAVVSVESMAAESGGRHQTAATTADSHISVGNCQPQLRRRRRPAAA